MKVACLALAMKIKTLFRNGIPGKDWVDDFKKRHPDLYLRSPTPLNSVRARMLNLKVTQNCFAILRSVLNDLGLQVAPSLTDKPAQSSQKNVPGDVGKCQNSVTVLACINAAGRDYPPLVIVKG